MQPAHVGDQVHPVECVVREAGLLDLPLRDSGCTTAPTSLLQAPASEQGRDSPPRVPSGTSKATACARR